MRYLGLIVLAIAANCTMNAGTNEETAHLSRKAPATTSISINNDTGGYVRTYAERIGSTPANTRVEITGTCASACTLWLAHENVCTTAHALFRFHGPSQRGVPLEPIQFESISASMASFYPEPIRSRFLQTYRYAISEDRSYDYSGAELIALGVISRC